MNILFASSEAVPFAKTGGLADVCGALPVELARLGHNVSVFLPAYRQALNCDQPTKATGARFKVAVGSRQIEASVLQSSLPESDVPVYLIEQDEYYDRPELYREAGNDYADNCERFVFFSRSVLYAAEMLDLRPDLLHLHDWQTSLIAAYLQTGFRASTTFENTASILTIHNMQYQGLFPASAMDLTGIDRHYFNYQQMEFFGKLNLLKTGLAFADAITTVSPRYAMEIQTAEQGCGLEGLIQEKSDVLHGILNGVDYRVWNPATDTQIDTTYDITNWREGKARCKESLRQQVGLPQVDAPLMAFVGRLADQKGLDLLVPLLERWLDERDVQWVILGTGEPKYHKQLSDLAEQHAGRLAVRLEFSDALAHQIEAGADFFLMPSLYEPCGLNQLYSLKYGTPPIVRSTGGLADSVTDCTPESLIAGEATGFRFDDYSSEALEAAVERAVLLWASQPSDFERLVETGMRQDFSWSASARHYVDIYQETLARHPSSGR